jgi:hypothetical protein
MRPSLLLALTVFAFCYSVHAQAVAEEAIRTAHWTKAEVKDFHSCVVRMDATRKQSDSGGGSSESWCEVSEERRHWFHLHPSAVGKKEIPGQFSKCNHTHAAEMNGTPQQFRATMNQCLCEAYGFPIQ